MEQYALAVGRTFVWHEVYAPDAQKTIDFYTKALGFGSEEMPRDDGPPYKMLTKNGQPICGVWGTKERPDMAEVKPQWATYLAVDDVDASLEKCKQNGATVIVEPMDIPKTGRMALIADPQGAQIWLFKDAGNM